MRDVSISIRAALLAVLLGISWGSSVGAAEEALQTREKHDGGAPAIVRVLEVRSEETICSGMEQNCTLEAIDRAVLYSRVNGRLEKLIVRQSEVVKTGQTIAVLEHRDQDARLASARAQITVARAQVSKAWAELENARKDLERYRRLLKEGFSTRQQLDAKETSHMTAKAQYDVTRAQVRQLEAELERIRADRAEYFITAPIDGTVLRDYSHTVGNMLSTSTPILEVADLKRLKAVVRVPETRVISLREGMKTLIRMEAFPEGKFTGRVRKIDPFIDPATRTSSVEIEVDNNALGGKLRPGMFGKAFIVEREARGALVVPESVLLRRNGRNILVLARDGHAKEVEVTTGISWKGRVQILSGLREGDLVIVSGGKNLADGDPVTAEKN